MSAVQKKFLKMMVRLGKVTADEYKQKTGEDYEL